MVLGAGASKDFCRIFPTGLELIKEINYHFITQRKSNGSREYISDMTNQVSKSFSLEHGKNIERFKKIKEVLWEIQLHYEWYYLRNKPIDTESTSRFGDLLSIDRFTAEQLLDEYDKKIIKFCIYYLIKGYEQAVAEGSYILDKCWINQLAQKVNKYECSDIVDNLTVITFNYDRTFERYFPDYLARSKAWNEDQKCALRKNVKHVYDSLGCLEKVPFEWKNNDETVGEMYNQLKLIGDQQTVPIEIDNAEQFKKVHFIGFGYDKENLKQINLDGFRSAKFRGTAYRPVADQIEKLRKCYKIEAEDITCSEYVSKMDF